MNPQLSPKDELTMRFIVDLLGSAGPRPSEEELQASMQAFFEGLGPWLLPSDLTRPIPPNFTLFRDFQTTEDGKYYRAALSPEGEALFRAWLRRQGIDPDQICQL